MLIIMAGRQPAQICGQFSRAGYGCGAPLDRSTPGAVRGGLCADCYKLRSAVYNVGNADKQRQRRAKIKAAAANADAAADGKQNAGAAADSKQDDSGKQNANANANGQQTGKQTPAPAPPGNKDCGCAAGACDVRQKGSGAEPWKMTLCRDVSLQQLHVAAQTRKNLVDAEVRVKAVSGDYLRRSDHLAAMSAIASVMEGFFERLLMAEDLDEVSVLTEDVVSRINPLMMMYDDSADDDDGSVPDDDAEPAAPAPAANGRRRNRNA